MLTEAIGTILKLMDELSELKEKTGLDISRLNTRQRKVASLMLNQNLTIGDAMKETGYAHAHITTIQNGRKDGKIIKSPLTKLKELSDKNFVKECKRLEFLGTDVAKELSRIVRDPKERSFDKIQAIKTHWIILSSSNKLHESPVTVQAQNVMILAKPVSIEEFNKGAEEV